MANPSEPEDVTLDRDQVKVIRRVLLIGLAAYGEVERLTNAQEIMGASVPDELKVEHPTGCADTVGEFAEALRAIGYD